jgi:hypothetical protein
VFWKALGCCVLLVSNKPGTRKQASCLQEIKGEQYMSTTAVNGLDTNAVPEAKPKAEKKSATPNAVNKYAEVRLAKKKQRRKAHRLTIKRSNTGG